MQVSSNNISLEVQEFGHKDNIPLIMISGFGLSYVTGQLISLIKL